MLTAVCFGIASTAVAQSSTKTFLFFVRHAEPQTKLISTGSGTWVEDCNPSRSCCTTILNPLGIWRRDALAQWFVDQGLARTLTHLIGDNKQRTVETLQKLAIVSGLKVQQYPPNVGECEPGFEAAAGSQAAVVSTIRTLPLGSRAVIANHTETLYRIMSQSAGIDFSDPVDFPKETGSTTRLYGFDNLWIVEVDSAGAGKLLQRIAIDLKPEASSDLANLGRAENLFSGVFHFAQAGGGGGASTAITLSNPSTTRSISATVSFLASDGTPLDGVVSSAVIPPSGKLTVSSGTQGPARSGHARVSASDPLVATATFSRPALPSAGAFFDSPPPARGGTSYNLPGLRSLVVSPSAPSANIFLAPIARSIPEIENGVAIANVSSQKVRVLLGLLDSRGNKFLESSVMLASGEQISRTLAELVPGVPEKFVGTLRIAASPLLPSEAIAPIAVTILQFGPGQFNEVPLRVLQ
ncbi:MAG: hypothetical protein HY315_01635 [Acidobacteria bacterium]|nr:hypothetical protein [Acidobacteriota bacterium]